MRALSKFLLACLCLLISTVALSAPMSESQFTQHFVSKASAALQGVEFHIVEPLQVNSKNVGGFEVSIFLGNAYTQYTSSPDSLDDIVGSQIKAMKSRQLALASQAAGDILAVVKPADYFDNIRRQLAAAKVPAKEFPLVYEKLNDDLYCIYVFDSETGMRMVSKKDLAEINIGEDSLRSLAVRNLSNYFEKNGLEIRRLKKVGNARIYAVALDENYEASILLLDKFWTKQTFDIEGDIVAFVPARNVVIVTGSADAEGMRIAKSLAQSGFEELGYAISPRGYRFVSGTWRVHSP